MNVLVACEFSGIVRDAFRARGHNAWSCDLLKSERGHPHYQCRIEHVLSFRQDWDMMIAFPPCTHLAVSGARWFPLKRKEQREAIEFFMYLTAPWHPGFAEIPKIVIENPIGIMSTKYRKPDQIIQPHQFGHPEFKATCLWLKGVPLLKPTRQLKIPKRGTAKWMNWNKVWRASPGGDRWKERSRTYTGIARAMAAQWG